MTTIEIQEKRALLVEEADNLIAGLCVEGEEREFTEEEATRFDVIKQEIANLDDEARSIAIQKIEALKQQVEEIRTNEINIIPNSTMETNVTLASQISEAIKNRTNVTIPMMEKRTLNANDENGSKVVETDIYQLLTAIRNKSVFGQLPNHTYLSGIQNNQSIPVLGKVGAGFVVEGEEIPDGAPTTSKKVLKPHLISAKVVISNQLLMQDVAGIEDAIKNDMVAACAEALDLAIFSQEAESEKKGAGLFYNVETRNAEYDTLLEMEKKMEEQNFTFDAYIVSPSAKHALRKTSVSGGRSDIRMCMEGNEVLGTKAVVTNAIQHKGVALIDSSDAILAAWNSANVLVDVYTLASKNQTQLIVTLAVDWAFKRDAAVAYNLN